ncbi:MAG: cyclic pyranopterin monophosphate synthase MoaC [Planctomycetota bacterium]
MASTHFNPNGDAHMVDVSGKAVTKRTASAIASVSMSPQARDLIQSGTAGKGDVLAVARLAAIMATKQTQHLIPLCHALPIESVTVDFEFDAEPADAPKLHIRVTCETTYKTGIEMEAMTGASIAALTVYDMLKSTDRSMQIGPIRLERKTGGASGDHQFVYDEPPAQA